MAKTTQEMQIPQEQKKRRRKRKQKNKVNAEPMVKSNQNQVLENKTRLVQDRFVSEFEIQNVEEGKVYLLLGSIVFSSINLCHRL